MKMENKKKTLWIIGIYLMIGSFYGLYKFFLGIFGTIYDYHPDGIRGFMVYITNTVFYPMIVSFDLLFDITLRYSMYWWLVIIIVSLYIIHYTLSKFTTPFWVDIKHIFIISLAFLIFFLGALPIVTFDEEMALKSNNYRTMLEDYADKVLEQEDQSYFEGMTFYNNKISMIFVNNEYMLDYYDRNNLTVITTLGFILHDTNSIYINFDGIKVRTNSSEQYYDRIENTVLHEMTHYFDIDTNKFGNNMETFGFVSEDTRYTINTDKWIGMYNNETDDIPEHLRRTIDFETIFYDLDYDHTDWKNEVVARITALCLELDEDNNYNSVKLANYSICQNFNFTQNQFDLFDIALKDFVISYVDTFYYNQKEKIILRPKE